MHVSGCVASINCDPAVHPEIPRYVSLQCGVQHRKRKQQDTNQDQRAQNPNERLHIVRLTITDTATTREVTSMPAKWQTGQEKQASPNYQRNLMALTPVPTMALVWLSKLCFSVPRKKPLAP
jgi:hypothetical protein